MQSYRGTAADADLREHLIAVALGDAEPDLVVENGRVFNVFTREWQDTDIAIAQGRIAGVADRGTYEGGERLDAADQFVIPGFVDAHVHIESAMLTPEQFTRAVLPHGTTTVVAEPHEIANVLGVEGVEWFMDACRELPIDVFTMAPSCVPASSFESPRAPLGVSDIERILQHPLALGVGEMMNFPGIIHGHPENLGIVNAHGALHVDGHAPGVSGRDLDAYLASGIDSDHESTTLEEAVEKRRKGMWVLLREASNARNLVDLLPMISKFGTDRSALCTDDREPDFLLREGHINQMCRIAVQNGISAEEAIVLSTINPCQLHGLRDRGAIAPGFVANLAIVDHDTDFHPNSVIARGLLAFAAGAVIPFPSTPTPEWVCRSVNVGHINDDAIRDTARVDSENESGASTVDVRVIGIRPGQLLTDHLVESTPVLDSIAMPRVSDDRARIAVFERHHATGRIGSAFVRGFNLKSGAFASSVAHDAHNIVVVGHSDSDMVACVNRITEMQGGLVVIDDGKVLAELALPIAGLMSDRPIGEVATQSENLRAALGTLGVTVDAPFMILSFLALSVIPSLKLTDLGLVDVDDFSLVSTCVDTAQTL